METKDFVQAQFDFLQSALLKVTDGLDPEELGWRPGTGNPIAYLMLHIARSEDINISARLQGKTQVWVSGDWYKKYGLTPDETTFGWTEEKLVSFKYPSLKEMIDYAASVHAETTKYLSTLDAGELERIVNLSYLGDIPIGKLLARTIIHLSGHIGEISYIRGLKRGINQ
jgi:hypothetical protein